MMLPVSSLYFGRIESLSWKHLTIVALASVLLAPSAYSQSSKEFAQMARATWSAFECASLASVAGDNEEQKRTFEYGYEQGKQFIAAIQAKKVKKEDLSTEAPAIVLMLLEGPSPDFMLGRVFEAAQDNALKDVFNTNGRFNLPEQQQSIARRKLWQMNCMLIGKVR